MTPTFLIFDRLSIAMVPPTKRQRQLRLLLDAKRQNLSVERADAELADEVKIAISDDDFDLDGIAIDQEL